MFYHKNEAFYINAELVSVMALVMQAMGESKIISSLLPPHTLPLGRPRKSELRGPG